MSRYRRMAPLGLLVSFGQSSGKIESLVKLSILPSNGARYVDDQYREQRSLLRGE